MTDDIQKTTLELPPGPESLGAASHFITKYAEKLGMEAQRIVRLKTVSEHAIQTVMQHNSSGHSKNRVGVDIFEHEGRMFVEVLNRGVPIYFDKDTSLYRSGGEELDKFSIENLGRKGQTVILGMGLGEKAVKRSMGDTVTRQPYTEEELKAVQIRRMEPGEERELSELFYFVYGYDYINDFVYYPEKIRDMLEQKKLISVVAAMPDGKLLGHVGLMKWNDNPAVYEPCLGVSNPQVKSKGFFSNIFKATMALVGETPMQYCFFDFVTNHIYSQKMVSHYNPATMALFIGCQAKETQAKLEKLGIGDDPSETDRYSLLYSIIPQVEHPFGKEICLPNSIGELLGYLLKPLNLRWYPSSRFEMLQRHGEYQTHLEPSQSSVVFDLFEPGRDAVERILGEWRQLQKIGYQYAAVELPLGRQGTGNLHEILSDAGFFVAGFIPFHRTAQLGFRFQTVGPTKLDFDEIKTYGEQPKQLLSIIRDNYERNNG